MRKYRIKLVRLLLFLGLLLPAFTGCAAFSRTPLPRTRGTGGEPVTLTISFDPAAPGSVAVTWDPASLPVDAAEASVTDGGSGASRTITVTVRIHN